MRYNLVTRSSRQEVLIKAVIQAIPAYTMNCFQLPVKLCKDIETKLRHFWWGHKDTQRKIHWIRWESFVPPKGFGLGFREL